MPTTLSTTQTHVNRRPDPHRGLNPAQTEAVQAPAGPLLVLAGAGTGKTRVVIARILHLVQQGTAPERILAVTFTNKAAREMVLRIGGKFKKKRTTRASTPDDVSIQKPEISTIHSLCVRILRRHAEHAGYPARFVIVDRSEQETAARRVLKELKVADATLRPADLLARISHWKSRGVRADEVFDTLSADADDSWDLAAAGYQRYQRLMHGVGAVDFDDLLLVVDQLFDQHETIRQQEAQRFDHILVDEYQDTSGIQERILSALARDHRSLCVVGDDDQSIYAWRGAQISHILDFPTRWSGATVVRLEENYRSTPEIIEAANKLIERNSRRHDKTLVSKAPSGLKPSILQAQDEVDEARRVTADVEGLLRERYAPHNEMAILVRTGEQTRVFETELRHRNIPYELIGSRSFFDRREVKDVLSFLRLLVDQTDDLALSRIANVPPRGLSYNAVEKARKKATESGESLWSTLLDLSKTKQLSSAASAGVERLKKLIDLGPANAQSGTTAAEALQNVLNQANYQQYLEKEFEDEREQEARWQSVEEIVNGLARHEKAHKNADPAAVVQRYLDDLILEVQEAERFEDDKPKGNTLKLMTLHAAKGLEFDCVWMVGLEENLLPHIRAINEGLSAIDEERRLCYVGVTRARKRLVLSLALTRMKWGKAKPCKPSRFLYELTGQSEKFTEGPAKARKKVGAKPRTRRAPS